MLGLTVPHPYGLLCHPLLGHTAPHFPVKTPHTWGVTLCHILGLQWLANGGLNISDLGVTVPNILGSRCLTFWDKKKSHLGTTLPHTWVSWCFILGSQWSTHRHHFAPDLWVMVPHILCISHDLGSNCPTVWGHSAPLFGVTLHHTLGWNAPLRGHSATHF